MRISYRATTLTYLGLCAAHIVISILTPAPKPEPAPAGAVNWDPCSMCMQPPQPVQIATLTFVFGLVTVLIQGLRNRPAPQWVALLAIVALGLMAKHALSLERLCHPNAGAAWLFVGVTMLLCVHHLLPRQSHVAARPRDLPLLHFRSNPPRSATTHPATASTQ